MPRSTRRTRPQAPGTRKRAEPNIPHHLMRRTGPATLEPTTPDDAVVEPVEAIPANDPPRAERTFMGRSAMAAAGGTAASRGAVSGRTPAAETARRAVTDYGYVIGELQRIFITALVIAVALIVVAVVHG